MGVLKRLFDVSKAAVNEALDKLEQPDMMMNHYLRNMEEEIHSLRQAILKEAAAQRQWEQQIIGCNRLAEQSERKAGEAMADDRMIEARQALEAKLAYLDKAAEYTQAAEASKLRCAELERRLNEAQAEFAGMRAKREELVKRAQKVQVQGQAQAQASAPSFSYGAEAGSAARGFQRVEETILQKEAQLELASSMKAAAAASREALIEEQLARLKNTPRS